MRPFVASHTAGDKALFTDSNLTYNPANNAIGTNITGSAAFATNATHANNANTVAFTNRDSNNETDYIAFVANHTAGDKALYTDANLTYNPANNYMGANVPYATTAGVLAGYEFYDNSKGYARIGSQGANKFLINWGVTGTITQSSSYQTFRTSFGAIYSIVTTRNEATTAASYAWSNGQVSTSGFRVYSNGARSGTWYWIAVGR